MCASEPRLRREIKSKTSAWIKRHGGPTDFNWQEGYSAFTVSESNVAAVIKYIERQPVHHGKLSPLDELRQLLKKHSVTYDPRYLK